MRIGDRLRFLARLAADPARTGAVTPSGRALARAMAEQVDPGSDGPVLELGPGTGVVTQALIARGIAAERITAIEFDTAVAAMVRARCPGVEVIEGDAFDLARTIGERGGFAAVVSSLPLLNFAPALRSALADDVFARLAPGASLVQFSYGFAPPVAPCADRRVRRAALVLKNLPPARVWVYTRTCDKSRP